uniref:Uncharacterized protein n=1 Tax=Craspedostauros australis TaxID=1486917 RepID=A0A6T6FM14_9STRA|mmetsp:Transcript_17528/g.48629  ORF Transcript_17528/g.48629 Transcript_17528/m.48629 type:complete len:154 (+) Transcript_17528:69-530(+)
MAIQSKNWSKAATICIVHNDMEASLFDKLTDEQTLPAIDTSVAHELLMADAKLHETTSISNLQRRCIRSITQNWDEFQSGYKSSDDVSEALGNLPSHVLADILVKSMAQPKRNGAAAKAEASADDDSKRMGDANDVRGAESDDQDSHLDDDDE